MQTPYFIGVDKWEKYLSFILKKRGEEGVVSYGPGTVVGAGARERME